MIVIKPIKMNNFELERDTPALFYNSDGELEQAEINEPRYNHNPETLAPTGLLLEDAATNFIPYSQNFSLWTDDNSISAVSASSPVILPDGTSGGLTIDNSMLPWSRSVSVGTRSGVHVFSVFVKAFDPSTARINIALYLPSGTPIKAKIATNFDSPSLVSSFGISGWGFEKLTACEFIRIYFYADLPAGDYMAAIFLDGDDVAHRHYIWGAQVEAGGSPTSLVNSNGAAATRAADVQLAGSPAIVETNVPEDDNEIWLTGEHYAIGESVMVLGQVHRNYTALTNNNGKYPPDHPDDWLDVGATNRWRMVDYSVGSGRRTELNGDINFKVLFDQKIKDIAIFDIIGNSVEIKMYSGDELVYGKTASLVRSISESSYFGFYFENRGKMADISFLDLPPVPNSLVEITIFGDGGSTAVGKFIPGYGEFIGIPEFNSTSIGISDYSIKNRDSFGNYFVQEGRYFGNMKLKPILPPSLTTRVQQILADCRATASAYVAEGVDEEESLMLLGFYEAFDLLFSTPAASYLSISLEAV